VTGRLLDAHHDLCARLVGDWSDGLFSGQVVEYGPSAPLVEIFRTYELCVNEQRFVEVDRLDAQLEALGLCFAADGTGQLQPVTDVQIYPTSGRASFRRAPPG
jgi:hypothetical protein